MSFSKEEDRAALNRLLIPSGDSGSFLETDARTPFTTEHHPSFGSNESAPRAPSPWLTQQSPPTFSAMSMTSFHKENASSVPPPPPSSNPLLGSMSSSGGTPTSQQAKQFRAIARSPASSRPGSKPSSRQSSRAPSPTCSEVSDELPNNVSSEEQLRLLPSECLSEDPDRPLRHVDESGRVTTYSLQPMWYSVIFILVVELLERFSFYGLNYTQTSYLTGAYDEKWNAGMSAVKASSYVSISVAAAYTAPFIGAVLADALLGDYWSILVGSLVFYLPGLFLIAFTTIPGFLGKEFNTAALGTGLLFLWPTGTGIVKSVVNIFGAKQFHPLCQSSMIESYYVSFYMCINIGALVGGILVPVWAQHNVTEAYFIPVVVLTLGIFLFLMGGSRYVRSKPKGNFDMFLPSPKPAYGSPETIPLSTIFRISLLIVPFNIAYSQMATTFIVQGTVMKRAFGWIDAASMNNADAVAVLVFGYVVGTHVYPSLANRGIKIPTTYKFAFGSALGALAIGWALIVEALIHAKYEATGHKVSILWQVCVAQLTSQQNEWRF